MPASSEFRGTTHVADRLPVAPQVSGLACANGVDSSLHASVGKAQGRTVPKCSAPYRVASQHVDRRGPDRTLGFDNKRPPDTGESVP